MKPIFLITVAIIATLIGFPTEVSTATQENRVFECVVTRVGKKLITVVCDSPNLDPRCTVANRQDPNCRRTTFDVPHRYWKEFAGAEWASSPRPQRGLVLKAQWSEAGDFQPVASCEERRRRAEEEYCGGQYCRPPVNGLTPLDCGLPHSPLIKRLLRAAGSV